MDGVPHYWATETSGVLQPAVEAYLRDQAMTPEQIAAMRAYLRQWIEKGNWLGPSVGDLKAKARRIQTQADIYDWIYLALREGIDPL